MNRSALVLACALALGGIASAPSFAQTAEMTQEEITERFRAQKTRGLKIVPVAPADGADAAQSAPASTQVGIADLPPEQQVNINIRFDFDSASLREDQKPKLTALCGAMKDAGGDSFRILGHTDASGSDAYNQRLSKLRADEVKRFLVTDCGIAPERLLATGVGEQFPVDSDDPRADINRRVEFQIVG